MKDSDSLTNAQWLTDVRDTWQGQNNEIERLRAVGENMTDLKKALANPTTQMRMLYAQELAVKDKEIERLREIMRKGEEEWEAECKRLRAALESIAANTCCDKCQEAALVAKQALGGE